MYKVLFFLSCILHTTVAFNIPLFTRRDALYLGNVATSALVFSNVDTKPICVIGASGETGKECVKLLADNGQKVRAVSRRKADFETEFQNMIEHKNIDIKDVSKINNVIQGASAVIFLANAKKYNRYIKTDVDEFQNYEDIDVFALKNIVHSCIQNNIPRLVYVSASCRSCELDQQLEIDKMSGIKCENCRTKQIGEKIIKSQYHAANKAHIDYTIIRIGYLISGNMRNISDIEINQDYTKSGMISKIDLANMCINVLASKQTAGATFEAYYRDTTQPFDIKESLNKCTNLGKPLEECFFGSSFRNRKPKNIDELRNTPIKGSLFTTGFESQGDTWNELFKDLQKDKKHIHKVDDNTVNVNII